ncbi:MAG TPA: sigma-70 family RNA polymerase sigma factor, partial [Tissierellaceae bacterium]|nr:sigma-70 family RNA polymerase sigma factor [Tissierellaceae bacterium]
IVEDNHNLIYSFIHRRGLDVDEYYGLVAESLCRAVMNWDESKGALSTIFYTIATNDLYREWRKGLAGKRQHEGIYPLEEDWIVTDYDLEDEVMMNGIMEEIENSEFGEVFELKLLGYNHSEIADMLDIHPITVGRQLKKVGERYFDRKG